MLRGVHGRRLATYGKIFSSLFHGSMIGQRNAQHVFVYLISHADRDGHVDAHPLEISTLTGIPEPEVQEAIKILSEPDEHSRTLEDDGRRIERIDQSWTWFIINYAKYLSMQDREVVRGQNKERKRKSRAKSRSVTDGHGSSRQGEVERERELEKDTPLVPDGTASAFEAVWKAYPHYGRRSGKAESQRRWKALKPPPPLDSVLTSLEACRISDDWTRENGRYVPALEVWIGKRGWDSSEGVTLSEPDDPVERMRRKMGVANGRQTDHP